MQALTENYRACSVRLRQEWRLSRRWLPSRPNSRRRCAPTYFKLIAKNPGAFEALVRNPGAFNAAAKVGRELPGSIGFGQPRIALYWRHVAALPSNNRRSVRDRAQPEWVPGAGINPAALAAFTRTQGRSKCSAASPNLARSIRNPSFAQPQLARATPRRPWRKSKLSRGAYDEVGAPGRPAECWPYRRLCCVNQVRHC